jgi:hypothetical protein
MESNQSTGAQRTLPYENFITRTADGRVRVSYRAAHFDAPRREVVADTLAQAATMFVEGITRDARRAFGKRRMCPPLTAYLPSGQRVTATEMGRVDGSTHPRAQGRHIFRWHHVQEGAPCPDYGTPFEVQHQQVEEAL